MLFKGHKKRIKWVFTAIIFAVTVSAHAQALNTKTLVLSLPEGGEIHVPIQQPLNKTKYTLQEKANFDITIMKNRFARKLRQVECEKHEALIGVLTDMLRPIEIPGENTFVDPGTTGIQEMAQHHVDQIKNGKLHNFIVSKVNEALADPDHFEELSIKGKWRTECMDFVSENYEPEIVEKFFQK